MRDIYILENMAACQNFLNEFIQKGYSEESFLGVGSFSSSILNNENKGAEVKITPHFLEKDLIQYIVQGTISIFESEPILIQTQPQSPSNNLSKWLILNQHTSIFSLQKEDILRHIKANSSLSLEEFVSTYFEYIITKINEMRAQIVIVLFDIDMFKNYTYNFLNWLQKEEKKDHYKSYLKQDKLLEKQIIKELILFISNSFFNNKIAIIPSKPNYFPVFLSTIHEIKKELSTYSKDIIFRI